MVTLFPLLVWYSLNKIIIHSSYLWDGTYGPPPWGEITYIKLFGTPYMADLSILPIYVFIQSFIYIKLDSWVFYTS